MTNREKFFAFVACAAMLFSTYFWFFPLEHKTPEPFGPTEAQRILTNPTGTIQCPSGGVFFYSFAKPKPVVKTKIETVREYIYSVVTNTVYSEKEKIVYKDTASTIKDEEVIIATGIIPSWEAETNVYTYFNQLDGHSRMIYAQQPITNPKDKSIWEWLNTKSLGAYYGYGTKGRAVLLDGNWSVVRTGALDWNVKVDGLIYNNNFDAMLLVGGKYSWN
jgi:hypothetical protein